MQSGHEEATAKLYPALLGISDDDFFIVATAIIKNKVSLAEAIKLIEKDE